MGAPFAGVAPRYRDSSLTFFCRCECAVCRLQPLAGTCLVEPRAPALRRLLLSGTVLILHSASRN